MTLPALLKSYLSLKVEKLKFFKKTKQEFLMFLEYMLLNNVELHTVSFIHRLSIYEIKRILKISSERLILAFTGCANSD